MRLKVGQLVYLSSVALPNEDNLLEVEKVYLDNGIEYFKPITHARSFKSSEFNKYWYKKKIGDRAKPKKGINGLTIVYT